MNTPITPAPLLPSPELQYFGTDLSSYGHYFWKLEGEQLRRSKVFFDDLPFNPEQLLPAGTEKGLIWYGQVGDYAICAIAGSCFDKRGGTKSVFWTQASLASHQWKAAILSMPIARKMIEQMPFDVQW